LEYYAPAQMFDPSNNGDEKRDLRANGVGVSQPPGGSWLSELSRYVFETLREDGEFAFCRGRRDDGELPAILSVAPVSEHPIQGILERLEHEYALPDELDSDWAARPLTLARRAGRTMLILEDPGGEPLDRLLGQPMELNRFDSRLQCFGYFINPWSRHLRTGLELLQGSFTTTQEAGDLNFRTIRQ
jgi:hypothetical protein